LISLPEQLIAAAEQLRDETERLRFGPPITHVYNPLVYAWAGHKMYLERFGRTRKDVIFLGMNPGPFGMAQTGAPFGEVAAVRDWMKIEGDILKPAKEHPKRPIRGFACRRSEVSGRRLWGLFAGKFGSAEAFFARHFVVNYCPLAFMNSKGANCTPDKLPRAEREPLERACAAHLRATLELLQPKWIVGVGKFAERHAQTAADGLGIKAGCIPHPSPANPSANRDWAGQAAAQLRALEIW